MKNEYSEEFKIEAVRSALTKDQSYAKTAKELGVNGNTIHGWISRYRSKILTTGSDQMSLEQQNKELRKENIRLKEEREILKKFAQL